MATKRAGSRAVKKGTTKTTKPRPGVSGRDKPFDDPPPVVYYVNPGSVKGPFFKAKVARKARKMK
jgi:hypothetical protein